MTFKTALKKSINDSDSTHLNKNIMALRSLFVPLWSAAATQGGSIWQRVQIDAIGGLVKTSSSTIINVSEFKNSTPGDEYEYSILFINTIGMTVFLAVVLQLSLICRFQPSRGFAKND